MSDQAAPPAQPAAPAGPAPAAGGADPSVVAQLHEHAVQAEKHVEQLATGLAKVGADDTAIKTVSQMADLLRRVAKGLGGSAIKAQKQQPETMDSAAAALPTGPRQ